jgi:hypothetical protein
VWRAHVVDREKAKIGVFITLADSTGPMRTEAVKAGFYETHYGKYSKLQILTNRELFDGRKPNIRLIDPSAFKKAPKEKQGGPGRAAILMGLGTMGARYSELPAPFPRRPCHSMARFCPDWGNTKFAPSSMTPVS